VAAPFHFQQGVRVIDRKVDIRWRPFRMEEREKPFTTSPPHARKRHGDNIDGHQAVPVGKKLIDSSKLRTALPSYKRHHQTRSLEVKFTPPLGLIYHF